MTINKCQGQSMSHVSLVLKDQVFAHKQLYVGGEAVMTEVTLEFGSNLHVNCHQFELEMKPNWN
ncbi:uncharacterized protein PGTG_02122 [Puccinia graminis f. sp. tritici CRL 75-36-700-3]|uniref:Uncharacterized protein n=1 Tax=Puccinia graminis f. sp. tritici (strain CRL 75-36-700-3 / race SCCL) TaxID=418459 RepID=E3JX86_PUCGT|nr:uncharacterized protein PGTG_02122 [Puccinia graminis f. sp. tritici CRL 75-36-700-3]EFP76661.1 hypothetical protein PGTG_02122 [Puccinia graminis f. sp. tritici CRL 75-36-700-3]